MKRLARKALIALGAVTFGLFSVGLWYVVQGYRQAPAVLRGVYQRPMPLEVSDLTSFQLHALLTVQDPNFYSHTGADYSTSGVWTTITEGLVKELYFHPFSPGFLRLRKVKQTLLAMGFDYRVCKNEQLRIFLNRAYLGHAAGRSVYGFDDGARCYYGKSFAELSQEEYLGLVATLTSPVTLSPSHPRENAERVARIDRLIKGECNRAGKSDILLVGCAR